MKTLIITSLSIIMTIQLFADYKIISSVESEGMQMTVYGAVLLSSDDLPADASIKIFLRNTSKKKVSVITNFVGGHITNTDNGYSVCLIKASPRHIKGKELLKQSLDGSGVVVLAPNETTELPTITGNYELEEARRVIKKLSVFYSIYNKEPSLDYGILWRGEMTANTKK